jgi:hypothetical protein
LVIPWKVILATMVIFVCGVVTGALVIKTQGNTSPHPRQSGDVGLGPPGPPQDILRWLTPLNLATNQSEKIVKILQDSQATNWAIRESIAPLLHNEVERAHQAINLVLTPDQQVKYAELLKKPEMRTEGRGRRGGEGGGFGQRGTNRLPTNGFPGGFPGAGRGRTNRPGTTNNPFSNSIPANPIPAGSVSTNNSTNGL